jgi:hypothetical protein
MTVVGPAVTLELEDEPLLTVVFAFGSGLLLQDVLDR